MYDTEWIRRLRAARDIPGSTIPCERCGKFVPATEYLENGKLPRRTNNGEKSCNACVRLFNVTTARCRGLDVDTYQPMVKTMKVFYLVIRDNRLNAPTLDFDALKPRFDEDIQLLAVFETLEEVQGQKACFDN